MPNSHVEILDAASSKVPATSETQNSPTSSKAESIPKTHYPLQFWLVFAGLCMTGLISALDGSVLSTALPAIIEDLDGGDNYVWVVNVYFLTCAAFQPLYGQLADLWGRRYLMIGVTCIFLLGSGLCGGATSMNMLIGARAVQGMGAGGINMLMDMIICDLIPMRERASFMGRLFLTISIGTALGPFIGGLLTDKASWRWIFYINLPLGGIALIVLFLFLQVKWKKDGTTMDRLKKVDLPGNIILMTSTFSILWALTYGGTRYSWSSSKVFAPLILGFVGYGLFVLFESSRLCPYPVMPTNHFKNRTSCVAFFISFTCMTLTFWIIFFYPVYFQSVLGKSVTRSGVNILPIVICFPVFAAVGGAVITKTGRYKPVHIFAGAMLVLGIGLSSMLNQNTHTAAWAVFEIIAAVGMGLTISTTLQAVQAGLPESEVASSTGTWSFIRSLGVIWGVSIPAAIFNNRFDQLSYQIDPTVRDMFTRGKAYQHATADFVNSFPPDIKNVVINVYVGALRRVWLIGIAFASITFLVMFLEREITLRTELDTDFGLADKNQAKSSSDVDDIVNNSGSQLTVPITETKLFAGAEERL